MNDQETIVATCSVTKGDVPLDIKWYFNGLLVLSGAKGAVLSHSKRTTQLSIESVSHENQGNYTCIVKNQVGETNYTAALYVNGIIVLVVFSL